MTVAMPALDGAGGELVTRWRAAGAGSFVAAEGDAGHDRVRARRARRRARRRAGAPAGPGEAAWSCPAGLAGAHGAATGATHDGPGLDLALALAWPAVAALLSSAPFAARLAQIVHSGHAVVAGAGVAAARGRARRGRRRASCRSTTPTQRRRG